jgi:hypothetical protein
MLRKLEDWAAAAGLAEEGGHGAAREILRELRLMEQSRQAKIVVVAEDRDLTLDVCVHLGDLARRLRSELLYVSSGADAEETKGDLRQRVLRSELAARGVRMAWVPARGRVEKVLGHLIGSIPRVEFAVLVGSANRALRSQLGIPVFSL